MPDAPPTLDYQPPGPVPVRPTAVDYVVATLGATPVFLGAFVLLSFAARLVTGETAGPVAAVAGFAPSCWAAVTPFRGSTRWAARERARAARGAERKGARK